MTSTVQKRRRRWMIATAMVFIGCAVVVAALPQILGLPAAQRRLASEANKILAPGRVEFKTIRLSWVRPTEISSLVLRDAAGTKIVTAPHAVFSWNLWEILVAQPKTGTLALEETSLDIERDVTGKVNLYETLKPVISEHPPFRLKIEVRDGRLIYRDPAFSQPVVADRANVFLNLGMHSEPIAWDVALAQNRAAGPPARLTIVGELARIHVAAHGQSDLTLAFKGERWPWAIHHSLVEVRGELTGPIRGESAGRTHITSDATLNDLVAAGSVLGSDTLRLEKVGARIDAAEDQGAWSINELAVTSSVGSISGEGSIPPDGKRATWLEASVDLAAAARLLPTALHLRDDIRLERGIARLRADIRANPDGKGDNWEIAGSLSNLTAHRGERQLTLGEPARLLVSLRREDTTTTLERFEIGSKFLTATGKGDFERGAAVAITIDLAGFQEHFNEWIDFNGLALGGRGKIDVFYQKRGTGYGATADAAFRDVRVKGLPLLKNFERDQLDIKGKIGGEATAAGWPASWKDLAVRGSSGPSSLEIAAQEDGGRGGRSVSGKFSSPLPAGRDTDRLDAQWHAQFIPGRLGCRPHRSGHDLESE